MDSVQVFGNEVVLVFRSLVGRAAPDHSGCENAVSDAAIIGVFHIDNALPQKEEPRKVALGASLCWGVASDVQTGRLHVVQEKVARIR